MNGSGSIYDGGRALKAAVRPYPRKLAGEPLAMSFDFRKTIFEFTFRHEAGINAPTEIFVPEIQYPEGCHVEVSDGTFELDLPAQTLRYWHTPALEQHTVKLRPLKPVSLLKRILQA